MDKYRTLAANTALISIGTFASKFLLFFMVRFYTAYLSPSDYGTADLITQTANLLIPVVSFGITDGVFRFAMDSPSLRKNVFSSGILVLFAGGCFFALLSLVLYPMGKLNYEVVLVLVYAICSCIHSLCAQFTRGRGRMQIYAIQGILNTAFVVTLNILFLAGFHMGIIGYVIAISIADLLCTTFLVFKERLWEYVTWKPDLSILKSMLKYSIPMIPTTIFWWVTSVSDRYMIRAFIDSEANGMYTIACKIPTVMAFWQVFLWKPRSSQLLQNHRVRRKKEITFLKDLGAPAGGVVLFGSFLIAFAKPEIWCWLQRRTIPWQYVPILCVSAVYSSFVTFLGTIYMVKKRSNLYFWTSLLGASTNIVLNLILIPSPLGVHGAAIATMISYMVLFTVRAISTNKLIPMQLHTVKLILGTVILLIQCAFIVLDLPGWIVMQAVCPLLLFAIYGKVMMTGGKRVLKEGKSLVRRKLGK
ncbi:MAG: polysaccharide biosynthesis C-terminal domain-containing protein [Clostridia bacterium]